MRIFLILMMILSTAPLPGIAAETGRAKAPGAIPGGTYSTWEVFEADKCGSIWLIKRFVDPQARFKFYPKGTAVTDGIPFDTPDAKLRRHHNLAAYESILQHYQIDDPVLKQIGEIIHDIEVNTWKRKRFAETPLVESDLNLIIGQSQNTRDLIRDVLKYFDSWYQRLKNGIE